MTTTTDAERLRRLSQHILATTAALGDRAEFSTHVSESYLTGVYLALNAIADARLVLEGPDCTHMKTQFVQGNHDLLSTLTSVSGYHRMVHTGLHPSGMTDSREGPLASTIDEVARHPTTAGVLVSSMPMAFVTGADYDRLCRDASEATGKPIVPIRGLSLSGDWLDGYVETLRSLAMHLPLPALDAGSRPDPKKVALIGHFHDRNEGDQAANRAVLQELVEAAGGELVTVWLDGGPWADLERVAEAGVVVGLPYGRRAAKRVARRVGAKRVELPLPFGVQGTEDFVYGLADALGTPREAVDAYLDPLRAKAARRLEWVVQFVFEGKRVGYVGDPHLLPGLLDTVSLLGATLSFAIVVNREEASKGVRQLVPAERLLFRPRLTDFQRFVTERSLAEPSDLVITNARGLLGAAPFAARVEFGYPSNYSHALADVPFLGYQGLLAFVERMANALRAREVESALRAILDLSLDSSDADPGEAPVAPPSDADADAAEGQLAPAPSTGTP